MISAAQDVEAGLAQENSTLICVVSASITGSAHTAQVVHALFPCPSRESCRLRSALSGEARRNPAGRRMRAVTPSASMAPSFLTFAVTNSGCGTYSSEALSSRTSVISTWQRSCGGGNAAMGTLSWQTRRCSPSPSVSTCRVAFRRVVRGKTYSSHSVTSDCPGASSVSTDTTKGFSDSGDSPTPSAASTSCTR